MSKNAGTSALVLAGAPEWDADLLYVTGFSAPDPIVYVAAGCWRVMMVSALEYGRARAACRACGIRVLTPQQAGLNGAARRDIACWILALLEQRGICKVRVPAAFPSGILRRLEKAGIAVDILTKEPFPQRRIKTADELQKITETQRAAVIAMRAAIGLLADSQVDQAGLLRMGRAIVSAEMVQRRVTDILLRHGCYCGQTIVACGAQGADPHERGSGPLAAHQPIVIDIFPRHQVHGYCGDITRTVVKGQAPRALKHMYHTVKGAHAAALREVRAGAATRTVHQAAVNWIARRGYPSGHDENGFFGFMHATGHGLGLALHEAPSLGGSGHTRLRIGDVITIEPGLYYPEIGGIRIEDTVTVTATGWRYLVPCEKNCEIP
ncbi:MAG: M24 family metallopeptidase [Kiritimatiellia bacterium]